MMLINYGLNLIEIKVKSTAGVGNIAVIDATGLYKELINK